MTTATQHAYTLATRCDGCSQAATYRATKAGAHTVQLCGHHMQVSADRLRQAGFILTPIKDPVQV